MCDFCEIVKIAVAAAPVVAINRHRIAGAAHKLKAAVAKSGKARGFHPRTAGSNPASRSKETDGRVQAGLPIQAS